MPRRYSLYQNLTTIQNADEINAAGDWGDAAKKIPGVQAYLDASIPGRDWKPEYFQFYTHVADIDANDLTHLFTISNVYTNTTSLITRKSDLITSCSTGDIILDNETGKYHKVDFIGFSEVEVAK